MSMASSQLHERDDMLVVGSAASRSATAGQQNSAMDRHDDELLDNDDTVQVDQSMILGLTGNETDSFMFALINGTDSDMPGLHENLEISEYHGDIEANIMEARHRCPQYPCWCWCSCERRPSRVEHCMGCWATIGVGYCMSSEHRVRCHL